MQEGVTTQGRGESTHSVHFSVNRGGYMFMGYGYGVNTKNDLLAISKSDFFSFPE